MKGNLERTVITGAANTAVSLSTVGNTPRELLMVTAVYSGTATQAGVTVDLDSGEGAGYDANLYTGTADAENNVYLPDGKVFIKEDDRIKVTAPAGGSGVTCSIAIYTRKASF